MKRIVFAIALIFVLCSCMVAQEARHEVTIQGSGFFNKETTGNGTTHDPTNSGGLRVGYRYNINRWLAAEGDYDWFRNSQKYYNTSDFETVKTNVHAVTGSAIVKIPTSMKLKPYTLVGGGVMIFKPRDNSAFSTQTKGAFVYGGGADYALMKHVAVRAEYRGFVYKAPDFDTATFRKVDSFTHSAVPSAGLVFSF